MTPAIPSAFIDRAARLLSGGRRLLGLVGAPGSGKSTLARALAERFAGQAVVVPMDGFHLANAELARLGRASRKGAPDTFDAAGYLALLQRLRTQDPHETVYAPEFRREIEEAIAGAIAIDPGVPLVITEGNYLLLDEAPWPAVRARLDEVWFVEADETLRRERLLQRHVAHGRSAQEARDWVAHTDDPNALAVQRSRERADAWFRW